MGNPIKRRKLRKIEAYNNLLKNNSDKKNEQVVEKELQKVISEPEKVIAQPEEIVALKEEVKEVTEEKQEEVEQPVIKQEAKKKKQ